MDPEKPEEGPKTTLDDAAAEAELDAEGDADDDAMPTKRSVPAGVFTKCPECRETLLTADIVRNQQVCPRCQHHFALPTALRIELLFDAGTFTEHDARIESIDPLGFFDSMKYYDRIRIAQRKSKTADAFVSGSGLVDGEPVEAGFFVFEFMGGSMGSVVGEKITRVYERSLERRVPALIFCASGGARMQEGVLSLMQMAKTSAAISRLRSAGIPLLSILLNPTTGGVAASFAMLGDVTLAEPKAQIGFAGARVIESTIGQSLPPGFQRSEFLLEHGFVDMIVARRDMKSTIAQIVKSLTGKPRVAAAS